MCKAGCADSEGNGKNTEHLLCEFRFLEGGETLCAEDVLYIETKGHKSYFYLADGRVLSIYRKLDALEEDFAGKDFLRSHKSFLVNMRYIEKICSYVLTLAGGEQLSVPKARYKEVKRAFSEYQERSGRL